jgi:hypothetical protein
MNGAWVGIMSETMLVISRYSSYTGSRLHELMKIANVCYLDNCASDRISNHGLREYKAGRQVQANSGEVLAGFSQLNQRKRRDRTYRERIRKNTDSRRENTRNKERNK